MTFNGWKTMRIGDTGQVQAGRQRSPSFTEGKDRPYLRVANVFDGYIDTTDINIMKFTDKEYEIYRLIPGDILLNEGQTKELVGRPAMYKGTPENCCFQNTLIRYRAYQDFDKNYMLKVFQFCMYSGKFSEIASQTTSVAHLGVSRFADLKVKIPPLPEQQKIAEILGTWDTAIEQLEALIEKKQLLKRGLMQKLLTGKVRFRDFEREWETKTFQEITQINPRTDDWSGVFVGMEDVSEDGVLVTLNRLDISADFKTTGYSSFMDGDTLIAKITPCFENGKGAFVSGIGGGALGSTEFHVLRPNANMHPQYIYYQTRTYSFRQKGELSMQGSGGQQRVPTDFIRKYSVGIPKFDEQQRIVSVLENLDSEISILEQQLRALKTQKLGLMQQLLTGKRRVGVGRV